MNLKCFKYYDPTLIIYYQRNLNICIELKGKKTVDGGGGGGGDETSPPGKRPKDQGGS